jgi:hypothetical protein
MRTVGIVTSAIAAVTLAACQVVSDPPAERAAQNVEFLRGCWVAKGGPDGPYLGFLRLLPEGADGLTYQGYLHDVTDQTMKARLHLSFMRDGSSMTIRRADGDPPSDVAATGGIQRAYAPLPDAIAREFGRDTRRATYAYSQSSWIVASGAPETLLIYVIRQDGEIAEELFRGERDGCD